MISCFWCLSIELSACPDVNKKKQWPLSVLFQVHHTYPGLEYCTKDLVFAAIFQFSERQMIEMSEKSRGDGISSSSGRTHGTDEVDVNQFTEST